MEAIILAGGLGTRIKNVLPDVPKSMAPINGKPFLSFILDNLNKNRFDKVVLAVGYLGEQIEQYYGKKYKNLELVYSYEKNPLGTGGSLKKAMKFVDEEFIYVLNGDTYFDIDYEKLKTSSLITIFIKKYKDIKRYGSIIFNANNVVTKFEEKKYISDGYINGGVYYLSKKIFDNYNLEKKFSLEKDFIEIHFKKLNIKVNKSNGYFIDIGIPEDYEKAKKDFNEK